MTKADTVSAVPIDPALSAERLDRNIRPGEGVLCVRRQGELSSVTRSAAVAPLKLFVPPRQSSVPRVYMSSYGGGLLAGDETDLYIDLGPGSRCIVSSQASTKIYRNPDKLPCSQSIHARIANEAALVLAPEAISPFATSRYVQRQRFDLESGGNLLLIDWLSSGRYETGERFAFDLYESRQSIYYDGQHLLEDALRLEPPLAPLASPFRMGHYNCIGLMVVIGDLFQPLATHLLEIESGSPLGGQSDCFVVASPLSHGALVRILATETQPAKRLFEGWLKQIDSILKVSTWAGKF